MDKKTYMLMILDGFGIKDSKEGNAEVSAKTPNLDRFLTNYPHTTISASGLNVGLPGNQMGNSEVGHMNMGAGRIIYQDFTKINNEIETGNFFKNKCFIDACDNAKKQGSKLHLMGLLSSGGVHSHINHLKALLKLAKDKGLKEVYLHCFLDGRDVPPDSGIGYVKEIEKYMAEIGLGKIATIAGRYYGMDRDKRWERVNLAYNAIVRGEGEIASSAEEAVETSYANNKTDEFVLPTVIMRNGKPTATISENDSVIFFNFRPDRAREITRSIVDVDFSGFKRKYFKTFFVCMTQYDNTIENVEVAYLPETYKSTLGEYLSKKGLKQLRAAETEKYAHVTFFFNGGVEAPNPGEDRLLIPSPKVPTYDMKPEMSAYELTDAVIQRIREQKYDVIILNFANPDMVGHTGVFEAAVKAVEAVDECAGKIIDEILKHNGSVILTADHGNVEDMIDSRGGPQTAHTSNPVPFAVIGQGNVKLREGGRLADVAPTLLKMMNLPKPPEMTGKSIIVD